MKTNPNDNAYPSAGVQNYDESNLVGGLTKLEYFSALALQGILSRTMFSDKDNIAEIAVVSARALIDELNKQDEENN